MSKKQFCMGFVNNKPIGAVEKRFNYDYHDEKIIDNQIGKTYDKDNFHMLVIDGLLNQLNNENEQLKNRLDKVLKELYCKDRKLEELGEDIGCCDKQ